VQLREGIGRAHQRRADEDRIGAGELRGRTMGALRDAALGDDDAVARDRSYELERGSVVDRERVQVAGVDADHLRLEPDRARQLIGVVRLDERVQPQLRRAREHRRRAPVVEIAQEQQHGVGSRLLQLVQLGFLAEEALRQQRRGGH